jgi:hypothetical protein
MTDVNAEAKEKQAKSAEDKAKAVEEAYANQGTPTPTQEENDIVALGGSVDPHADDGSGPSPEMKMTTRQSESSKPSGGSYPTRSMQSQQPAHPKEPVKEHPKEPNHQQSKEHTRQQS